MCGICVIVGCSEQEVYKNISYYDIDHLLSSRGPDKVNTEVAMFSDKICGVFTGCVLWLQGLSPRVQPLLDHKANILLWNGDDLLHNSSGDCTISDTESISNSLTNRSGVEIVQFMSSIDGPWAFIYYESKGNRIYFGRDYLGRRSLLWSLDMLGGNLVLTSVAKRESGFTEVPVIGIFCIDLNSSSFLHKPMTLYLYRNVDTKDYSDESWFLKLNVIENKLFQRIEMPLCRELPSDRLVSELKSMPVSLNRETLAVFLEFLDGAEKLFCDLFKKSIEKRVSATPLKCKGCTNSEVVCKHSKFAVMFSGGLDSALITSFLHLSLPPDEPIDLVNVSFETQNIEYHGTRKCNIVTPPKSSFHSPDRESGIACWRQLQLLYPSRTWNFIEVNVTVGELDRERKSTIRHLIAPLKSVLDDSIGSAFYFCGRAEGLLNGRDHYKSPARVLLSGVGADEQCAGYSRHRRLFYTKGWKGLIDEIELEMSRIAYRNLGRDDRVLSHHGRTVRFPFLDDALITYLNSLPVWKKSNLYLPRGVGDKLLLRVVAASQGLSEASGLPKRAIQFGSRIAKVDKTKEKGQDICLRLIS